MAVNLKTAVFGGYKKQDVEGYIEQINQQLEERNKQHSTLIKSLRQELADKNHSLSVMEDAFKEQIANQKADFDRLVVTQKTSLRDFDDIKDQLEHVKKEHAIELARVKNQAAEQANQEMNELTQQLSHYKELAAAMEKERASISDALIAAQTEAQAILQRTKQNAEERQALLREELEETRRIAQLEVSAIEQVRNDTTDRIVKMHQDVLASLQTHQSDLEALIEKHKV